MRISDWSSDVCSSDLTLHLPPRLGVEPEMTAFTVETMLTPFNLSGNPALVQCTGFSSQGLPLHWQIAGRKRDEITLLRLAMAYEHATAWRAVRPSPTAHTAPSLPDPACMAPGTSSAQRPEGTARASPRRPRRPPSHYTKTTPPPPT